MFIKMTETRRGSPNALDVALYNAGDIYEVPHGMGTQFIRNGWAMEVEGEVVSPSPPSPEANLVANVAVQFNSIFRPQPSRGSAPTNPATLSAKGEAV